MKQMLIFKSQEKYFPRNDHRRGNTDTLFQAVKHGKMVIGDLLNITLSLDGSLESFPIGSHFVTLSPRVPSPRAVRQGKEPRALLGERSKRFSFMMGCRNL